MNSYDKPLGLAPNEGLGLLPEKWDLDLGEQRVIPMVRIFGAGPVEKMGGIVFD